MELDNYNNTLQQIKQSIRQSQRKAVLSVNQTLIELYWEIGQQILQQQTEEGWGTKVVIQLSKDLKQSFPTMKGLSERNLKYMRQFAQTYTDFQFVQQVVAQIPWGHNCLLMSKFKSIGLVLSRSKDNLIAEYALRGMSQPIGVSDYKITGLPSAAELQKILNK